MFLYPERSEGLARGLIASDIVILAPCGCERNGTSGRRPKVLPQTFQREREASWALGGHDFSRVVNSAKYVGFSPRGRPDPLRPEVFRPNPPLIHCK